MGKDGVSLPAAQASSNGYLLWQNIDAEALEVLWLLQPLKTF
jgi:hypothetical protein